MWPFNKKKQYVILFEEYEASKEAISSWYYSFVLSTVFLIGFLSAFVAHGTLWVLVPSAFLALAASRSIAAIKQHKEVVAQWMDQLRQKEMDRIMKSDL